MVLVYSWGTGACEVLKDQLPLLRVFIYADIETKICRSVEEYQELPQNIEKRSGNKG